MILVKLIWSERSLIEYDRLLKYLSGEWGAQIALRVFSDINRNIDRITNTPEQFPLVSKRKSIRKCVVSPQTSIFFKVTRNTIEIVSLFDNRQDPKKRKF